MKEFIWLLEILRSQAALRPRDTTPRRLLEIIENLNIIDCADGHEIYTICLKPWLRTIAALGSSLIRAAELYEKELTPNTRLLLLQYGAAATAVVHPTAPIEILHFSAVFNIYRALTAPCAFTQQHIRNFIGEPDMVADDIIKYKVDVYQFDRLALIELISVANCFHQGVCVADTLSANGCPPTINSEGAMRTAADKEKRGLVECSSNEDQSSNKRLRMDA